MKIFKTVNAFNFCDIKLKEDEKELLISLSGNGDLYMSMTEGRRLSKTFNDYIMFDINKKDEDIYNVFNNLYYGIMEKNGIHKTDLVDKDNNITWVSDEGRLEDEDSLTIIKYNDNYRLLFLRNNDNNRYDTRRKSSRKVDIRFSTSGSRYKDYTSFFMVLYSELHNIEERKVLRK